MYYKNATTDRLDAGTVTIHGPCPGVARTEARPTVHAGHSRLDQPVPERVDEDDRVQAAS